MPTPRVAATAIKYQAAELALAETRIRAPVSGELVQAHAASFMRVAADSTTPLFVLLPDAPHIIRAEVNEEFARLLHNGIAAQVIVDDDVQMVINASRVRVASSLRRRDSQPEGVEQVDSRVLDCEIEGDFLPLRVGQPVLVRFLKDGT
ncbi:MAG: HlyD family secretion protein [Pseudomonadota bacterium]